MMLITKPHRERHIFRKVPNKYCIVPVRLKSLRKRNRYLYQKVLENPIMKDEYRIFLIAK